MTKLEIKAIRALPEEYIRDGTCITLHMGAVYAIETSLPLIVYRDYWEPVYAAEDDKTRAAPSDSA